MSVFFLRMLEETGRWIALYHPKMGHLSKVLDGHLEVYDLFSHQTCNLP